MTINRYNYEEFFLLYADGELSPLETEMVNQFVQFHPDLKEELDILMDCKLVADIPVFFPKEKLYKQTIWDADNITEMQSNLLLLVDGELEEGFKKELEKNIEENPALQKEWNTLQQAKLPVEAIAHPYKKPLYKEKKIPVLGWLRWAAAAAIVGAGLFLVGKNVNENHAVESLVKGKSTTTKQQTVTTKPQSVNPLNTQEENKEESNLAQNSNEQTDEHTATSVATTQQIAKNTTPQTASKEAPDETLATDNTQYTAMNVDPVVGNDEYRTSLITKRVTDNVEDITTKPAIAKIKLAPKVGSLASAVNKKSSTNSADEIQSDADDDEYVRIAGARVKKQKIRGVFRNVFRGIGRTFSNSKVEAAPAMALNNE